MLYKRGVIILLYLSNLAGVVKRPNTPGCEPGIRQFESDHSPHAKLKMLPITKTRELFFSISSYSIYRVFLDVFFAFQRHGGHVLISVYLFFLA